VPAQATRARAATNMNNPITRYLYFIAFSLSVMRYTFFDIDQDDFLSLIGLLLSLRNKDSPMLILSRQVGFG
jgi:hypothetical protein